MMAKPTEADWLRAANVLRAKALEYDGYAGYGTYADSLRAVARAIELDGAKEVEPGAEEYRDPGFSAGEESPSYRAAMQGAGRGGMLR